MQDYDFVIVYRSGAQGQHVDYLSRNPVSCCSVDIMENEWIKVAQLQDPQISEIIGVISAGDVQPETKQRFDDYDVKNGVLFRRTKCGNKWVVPKMSRFHVAKYCNDDQGHFGLDKTLEKIRDNYGLRICVDL